MTIDIPDPFRPGHVFRVNPEKMIARCKRIYEATEWPLEHGGSRPHEPRDHAECPHCPRLREMARRLASEEMFRLEFSEMRKPWGKPLAGPTDTQPLAIQPETGFEVIEVGENEEGP